MSTDGPTSQVEAYAMLAHHALTTLWADSDFQPDGMGCCHICCAPCAALLFLDLSGALDAVLGEWREGIDGSDIFPDGQLDRAWMYRQWTNSEVQRLQCGHRLEGGVS